MAHHKRLKPKKARAGCLLCKPHKANGAKKKDKPSVKKKDPLIEIDEFLKKLKKGKIYDKKKGPTKGPSKRYRRMA